MRALLIIGREDDRSAVEEVLTERGWSVSHAKTADEALVIQYSRRASLVVADDNPDGSTAWLFGSLRRVGEGYRAPYLLGLAQPDNDQALDRLAEGAANDILLQPVTRSALKGRIEWIEAAARAYRRPPSTERGNEGRLAELRRQFSVQQAFLEGLFEGAPEGVVIVDGNDRILRINSEFTRMFGYSEQEAVERSLNDIIVPAFQRQEAVRLDREVREGERIMVETVRRHKDGTLLNVSLLATQIHVRGQPVGAFGIYRDITHRKLQEVALQASEERYRALFDQSPVGVLLCDKRLRITHCNEALTRIVDAPYHRLIGAHLLRLRDRRLIPGLRMALRGKPAAYQGPFRTWTGEQRHVSIQYAPFRDEDGQVIGGMGVLEDITHRVMAERQLRAQAAEMERVNAALRERSLELEEAMKGRSRLYTSMNHELRTPISAILLYQELMMAGNLGPLTDEQAKALDASHTATRHLLDLVREVLDLSKLEAGKVSLQPTEVVLQTLLDELHSSVVPLSERNGSTLRLVVSELPPVIRTDPQRVRQILLNFVSNAAKYGRGRPIEIRARSSSDGSGCVIVEVVDEGIGIAPENLGHVFQDFVQLGSSNVEGTGLGLAISRRLADLLGARLEVESEPDKGSTFRLILPAALHVVPSEPGAAEAFVDDSSGTL